MKLKVALLAAAKIVALVNATADAHDDASLSMPDVRAVTNTIPTVDPAFKELRAPDPCKVNCHAPWVKCVRDCGGGSFCEHICNCTLFSNPKQLCRVRGCVEPPDNCPARKLSRDTNDISFVDSEDTNTSQVESARVPNPCVICLTAIKSCNHACTTPGGCNCECFQKKNNPNCRECSIPCNSLLRRGLDDEQTSDDIQPNGQSGPEAADVAAPIPPNPCVVCQFSINFCKKQCAALGGCNDYCNCYHNRKNRNCVGCKIPCNCGHACPRLALRQREVHELEDLTEQDIQDLIDPADVLQV